MNDENEVDDIEAKSPATKLLHFCNPHNPGGRVWSVDELRLIAQLCRQEGVLLISDEIWADWCLFGNKHRPLALEVASAAEKEAKAAEVKAVQAKAVAILASRVQGGSHLR